MSEFGGKHRQEYFWVGKKNVDLRRKKAGGAFLMFGQLTLKEGPRVNSDNNFDRY